MKYLLRFLSKNEQRGLLLFLAITFSTFAEAQFNATVAKDGSGNYTTVQAAINAAPTGRTTPWIIYIKNGKYREKDTIPTNKPFIQLVGESVANVVISWDDYSGKPIPGGGTHGTSSSATFFVYANDFAATNITFENTTGESPQALAIFVSGDRVAFKNCRFLGGQDTIFAGGNGARQYYRNCYIDGTVDFIFGDARAVFDSCYIYPKTRTGGGNSFITAANTKQSEPYGYVFRNAKILMNRGGSTYDLGRPWQNDAGTPDASRSWNKTIFLNATYGGSIIRPQGWSAWDAGTNTSVITYAEYKNKHFNGTPVDISQRVPWSKQLTDAEAANYYSNSNLFGTWDPCSVSAGFCTNNQPELAVSNFRGVRGASATSFTWNASWPVSGVLYEVLKSTDNKVTFTSVNSQTSPTDTAVNFSYSEAVPPPGNTHYYLVRATKAGYTTTISADTVSISSTPTITAQGTLGNFLQGVGTPSNAQSYIVSASSLTNNLIITAPAGYELSSNGTSWNISSNPLVLTQDANGNIASTTIYVRLNASSAGTYNGNIVHASNGADTVRLAITGSVQSTPLTISEILQWHPMATNASDSAAVRSTGVTGSTPTLNIFSVSNGVQYDATPLPAYSATHGQALSGSPGGTGDWRTASGGPGGTLTRIHYEQFTVTAASGYTVRVDSLVLNTSFYQSLNNARIAVQYSLSNFVSDSAEITGGTSGGTSLTFVSNGGFTRAVTLTQEDASTNANFRFALNQTTGITVNTGQTLTVRLYFSCGSGSRNRYAKIKDLLFKGLSTKNPVSGDFRSYQTGVWTDLNTWERYNGTQWVHPAPEFPHFSNATDPIIQNGHIVTLASGFTEGFGYIARRTRINTGGQLVVNSGVTMSLANDGNPAAATADLLINGTLTLNGSVGTNGNVYIVVNGSFINNSTALNLGNGGDTVAVGTNGIWQQANNSFNTPTRFSFEPTALFRVTGLTNAQTGLFRNAVRYGNIVWNNPNESASYAIRATLDSTNVKGSFTVQNTGTTQLTFSQISGRKVFPGGYYQTGGTVNYRESGTGTDTLDLGGDFNVIAGTFNSNEGAGSSLLVRLTGFNKSIIYNGATANNTNWLVNGTYTLGSNLVLPSGGYGVRVNGTLNLGTSVVSGPGDFAAAAGAIISTGATGGIDGNLTNAGTKTFDPGSFYIFNGTTAQTTGSLFPATVAGLTVNNAAGVTLSSGLAVNGPLTLTTGMLTLGNYNIGVSSLVGANNTKYVITNGTGTLKINNVGTGNTVFPVGPSATKYNPATVNNAGTTDNFSVRVQDAIDITPPTANVVNKQWTITEDIAGGSNAALSLSWTTPDQAPGFDATKPVYIVRHDGTNWVATLATVTGSGTTASPYVATASGFSAFSPFIVTNAYGALPVLFVSTKAYTKGNGVQIEWSTASESNLVNFEIERSADGRNFKKIGVVAPFNSGNASYSWYDATPNTGDNFYRIRVNDYSSSKYTNILKIRIGVKSPSMEIVSNVVRGGMFNIQLSGMQNGIYELNVYNAGGQKIYRKAMNITGSSLTELVQLPAPQTGMYVVQLTGESINLTKKVVIH